MALCGEVGSGSGCSDCESGRVSMCTLKECPQQVVLGNHHVREFSSIKNIEFRIICNLEALRSNPHIMDEFMRIR